MSQLKLLDLLLSSPALKQSLRDQLYYINEEEGHTFQNDDSLPRLPVPNLQASMDRYLESVRSVGPSEEEYETTVNAVKEFVNGMGKELHAKLEARSKSHENWLEDWWLEWAYLRDRRPLVPHSNMAGPMPQMSFWPPQQGTRVERASLAIYFTMSFWSMIRNGRMRPMLNKGTIPWTMDQFKKLFNTVRLPGLEMDTLLTNFKTADQGKAAPLNIIVIYRGYLFSFCPILEDGEDLLTPPEIAQQLEYIEKACLARPSVECVASLTAAQRSVWCKNRQHIMKISPLNKESLKIVEDSLFVITFDDKQPTGQEEILQEMLAGDVSNRWCDKSLNNVFFVNGMGGGMADHTPFDGLVTAILTHYNAMSISECRGKWTGPQTARSDTLEKPKEVKFILDDHLRSEISQALDTHRKSSSDLQIRIMTFPDFGRSILSSHRFHPEAFVQIALQAAYMRMHADRGDPASVYCTASTRKFIRGRTETCRSCMPEVVDFARLLFENETSDSIEKQGRDLYESLAAAVKKFSRSMTDAMEGNGVDRLFLGLYCTALEAGYTQECLPALFLDPMFFRTGGGGNFMLSTSCAGYFEHSVLGGVPPLRTDGYATFYSIESKQMSFSCISHLSCTETDSDQFLGHIATSLRSMARILTHHNSLVTASSEGATQSKL